MLPSRSDEQFGGAVNFPSLSYLRRLARKENVGNERPFAVMGKQCGPCVHRERYIRLRPHYIAATI